MDSGLVLRTPSDAPIGASGNDEQIILKIILDNIPSADYFHIVLLHTRGARDRHERGAGCGGRGSVRRGRKAAGDAVAVGPQGPARYLWSG